MAAVVGVVLALHYLEQVAGVRAACTDDHAAYWGFIERQLQLGSVEEAVSSVCAGSPAMAGRHSCNR